jgi:hypothetical protein
MKIQTIFLIGLGGIGAGIATIYLGVRINEQTRAVSNLPDALCALGAILIGGALLFWFIAGSQAQKKRAQTAVAGKTSFDYIGCFGGVVGGIGGITGLIVAIANGNGDGIYQLGKFAALGAGIGYPVGWLIGAIVKFLKR